MSAPRLPKLPPVAVPDNWLAPEVSADDPVGRLRAEVKMLVERAAQADPRTLDHLTAIYRDAVAEVLRRAGIVEPDFVSGIEAHVDDQRLVTFGGSVTPSDAARVALQASGLIGPDVEIDGPIGVAFGTAW